METGYKTPPEKFAAFLKRQKMVFIVAFLGYVCAYLVRNNFKLMSKSIMVTNGWAKDDIAMLLSCLAVSYGLAKFYMGALGDKVSLRKLFVLVLVCAAFCWKYGGDSPEKEGLDSLRQMYGEGGESNVASEEEQSSLSYWQLIWKYVFCNPALLLVASVNVALYFIRFGVEDWMPIYLHEVAKMEDAHAQMAISVLEWVAIPGSLVFAWLAAKYPNKMARIGAIGLFVMAGVVMAYEAITASGAPNYALMLVVCGVLGALIYGPQLIVNILTINFVPLKVAGTAIGFVGVTAYLIGNMGANWVMPIMADHFGWFWSYVVVAGLSAFAAVGYLILARHEEEVIKA